MDKKLLEKPENYYNREMSWLQFNYRILNEAKDKSIPLFERLNFLSITESNLSEFFMVRVASLIDLVHADVKKKDIAGLTPQGQLDLIIPETKNMIASQYSTLNRQILPAMEENGLKLVKHYEDLNEKQSKFVDKYFEKEVYPVLTPMAVDSSRPFPLISNKTLNIGALIRDKKKDVIDIATVQVPSVLPRVVEIPGEDGCREIILLEQIIEKNLNQLFLNYEIICAYPYRIMRNADLAIDEDDASDLLKEIEKQIKKRAWGEVIRLDVEAEMDKRLLKELKKQLNVNSDYVYSVNGPLDLTFLGKVRGLDGFDHLKNKKYIPQPVKGLDLDANIFDQIKKKDILLHHPYDEFTPVIEFIKQAAIDPDVLAIKQTLYRVSGNSPIIAALALAAENGKQVTVLVELKARFDEENNINWAEFLQDAGCKVIYGMEGYKVHSKICLVMKQDKTGIKYFTQIGTGNYNASTSSLYTDISLITSNEDIGKDAVEFFQNMGIDNLYGEYKNLLVAPVSLKNTLLDLIKEEIEKAKAGEETSIFLKMNSLTDRQLIDALKEASQAGVKIKMIIRGICCILPGIEGKTDNIEVISVVGRFLEHSRIFCFGTGENMKMYIASADWMTRNTENRVEIAAPIYDQKIKNSIYDTLRIMWKDNLKARILCSDGTYKKPEIKEGDELIDCQNYLRHEYKVGRKIKL